MFHYNWIIWNNTRAVSLFWHILKTVGSKIKRLNPVGFINVCCYRFHSASTTIKTYTPNPLCLSIYILKDLTKMWEKWHTFTCIRIPGHSIPPDHRITRNMQIYETMVLLWTTMFPQINKNPNKVVEQKHRGWKKKNRDQTK